jgi:hypothetical protein
MKSSKSSIRSCSKPLQLRQRLQLRRHVAPTSGGGAWGESGGDGALNAVARRSIFPSSAAMLPTITAKVDAPRAIMMIPKMSSGDVRIVMSPYPTVVSVVKVTYSEMRYLISVGACR